MNDCKSCEKAVFDPLLGEYKCSHYHVCIYDMDARKDCSHYKKGEVKETEEPYYGREALADGTMY